MDDKAKHSILQLKIDEKLIRDKKYSSMRIAEWRFARAITLKFEDTKPILGPEFNKMLNIVIHPVGKPFHGIPVHYYVNWNTQLSWVFDQFAAAVNLNGVRTEWSAGRNAVPDFMTLFEGIRDGIISLVRGVVHLTCFVGMPSRKNKTVLTPSLTNVINEELAFACHMMDNLELEALESHRRSSTRYQRLFMRKIVREYVTTREWKYRCLYFEGETSEADMSHRPFETVVQEESMLVQPSLAVSLGNLTQEHANKYDPFDHGDAVQDFADFAADHERAVQEVSNVHPSRISVAMSTVTHLKWKKFKMLIDQLVEQHQEYPKKVSINDLIQSNQMLMSELSGLNETLCYVSTLVSDADLNDFSSPEDEEATAHPQNKVSSMDYSEDD